MKKQDSYGTPDPYARDRNLQSKAYEYGCTLQELEYWIKTGKKLKRDERNEEKG